jgi:uncharacterized phage infection (PIP) family protein YhgE
MSREFTTEEIKDAARAARVYCPAFSQEKLESLLDLGRRLDKEGYLQAVQGLISLESERGISCAEALEAYQELIGQKAELEKKMPLLEQKAEGLATQIGQANEEYKGGTAAVSEARQELAQDTGEHKAAEHGQEAFNHKMGKEKQRIALEVEEYRRQANVTEKEVAIAGQIKAEGESRGFPLELVLELAGEFAGHKDARDEFANGLKEHGSLTKYLGQLAGWAKEEETRLKSEIADLESRKNNLESYQQQLETALSQLQADIANEKELRHFYSRYHGLSPLIDHLENWGQDITSYAATTRPMPSPAPLATTWVMPASGRTNRRQCALTAATVTCSTMRRYTRLSTVR